MNATSMTFNRIRYRFDDFTLSNYRRLVELAKENGFEFSFFDRDYASAGKILLWRHDVEFSPHVALRMASIEHACGVKATYFFQLHSEFYNLLEREVTQIALDIRSMGHEVGLHFDSHFFDVQSEEQLECSLALDARYFQSILGTNVRAFSFHNTTPFILSCERLEYAGLLNVYARYYKTHFSYCADSTGYWRYELLDDVLRSPDISKLQVLTHDAMWSETALAPRQRVFQSVDDHAERLKRFYDAALLQYAAKNVDEDSVYE